ncbi:MAG: phosphoribosylformylglycinamidine synthase I [Planctomycetales bacterium]|nr:phosphoribosylformylglycinamidine synthase I [Planctomycetales bacterium]NIM10181.1 phosphoribosylformylglycinamidine synthase I [Planctomycetales bacterium]NIN09607.1 phosphoribosylformylglycinamidine synthase I [Planctomycetales bacterium]NIN78728.1 phosphoribosylformylglycinamidine synthase I [Planctomycetales bacterium]NIO35905.1 phosphoribosylformylglycinamidine synthase I [Planctomycetales bacterium]
MPTPRVLILRAPGTNCDVETAYAFEQAGGQAQRVHINRVLEQPGILSDYQILCVPGGFSYGDDIAAGRILANQIRHHLADCLGQFRADGKLILGICNGFQVLIKAGVLLDAIPDRPSENPTPPATLTWNDSGKFEDRWVHLKVEGDKSVFLSGIRRMYLPVAHAEGKFVARDAQQLTTLEQASQLVLRYCDKDAQEKGDQQNNEVPYPLNPNGSQKNVAGVCDTTGRVLGLMPHPERHIDPTQHPHWTRGAGGPSGDGLTIFLNAVAYFR